MLVRTVRVAMPAMEAVEVARLVRRVHRHAGKPRLFQIEDARRASRSMRVMGFSSPHRARRIAGEDGIGRQNDHAVHDRLTHEQSIERIAVERRQLRDMESRFFVHRQATPTLAADAPRRRAYAAAPEEAGGPASRRLIGDFPGRCRARGTPRCRANEYAAATAGGARRPRRRSTGTCRYRAAASPAGAGAALAEP